MTALEQRALIGKALDSIGEISGLTIRGFDTWPDTPTAGAAWPVFRELNPGTLAGAAVSRTYDVYCLLRSSRPAMTAQDAESLAVPLLEALHPLGEWIPPADVIPILLADGQTAPALRFRITPYD